MWSMGKEHTVSLPCLISASWTSLVVQWLKFHTSNTEVRVRSLISELRSHMPLSQNPKSIKQKQCCNKFNKDLKKKKSVQASWMKGFWKFQTFRKVKTLAQWALMYALYLGLPVFNISLIILDLPTCLQIWVCSSTFRCLCWLIWKSTAGEILSLSLCSI